MWVSRFAKEWLNINATCVQHKVHWVTGQNGSRQNGMDKMVYGQNVIGQNGTGKMGRTKWYGQNGSKFWNTLQVKGN